MTKTPVIKLFRRQREFDYEGDRTSNSFADFIKASIGAKSKRPQQTLLNVTAVNFKKLVTNSSCFLFTMYSPKCDYCRDLIPVLSQLASAFRYDRNVSIGKLDCKMFKDFCEEENVKRLPTVRFYKSGEFVAEFGGERSPDGIASFINKNCGTHRAADGSVAPTAGVVKTMDTLILEYFKGDSETRNNVLVDVRKKDKADIYEKVLLRLGEKGIEGISNDIQSMKDILKKRLSSVSSLDLVKTRLNVFQHVYSIVNKVDVKDLNKQKKGFSEL